MDLRKCFESLSYVTLGDNLLTFNSSISGLSQNSTSWMIKNCLLSTATTSSVYRSAEKSLYLLTITLQLPSGIVGQIVSTSSRILITSSAAKRQMLPFLYPTSPKINASMPCFYWVNKSTSSQVSSSGTETTSHPFVPSSITRFTILAASCPSIPAAGLRRSHCGY